MWRCVVLSGLFLSLVCVQAMAQGVAGRGETITLRDGSTLLGFASHLDLPADVPRNEDCGAYVFRSIDPVVPAADGQYTVTSGEVFLVEDNCLYPRTGIAQLRNGGTVEFYQEGTFNLNGERVYQRVKDRYLSAPDGTYNLASGQTFMVVDGHIDDFGMFENGKIVYQDQD